jgi:hypothetical protein
MTDTFASGPNTPSGVSPDAAERAGDVTGTLAELERKLRELEQELTSIGRRRTLASAAPGAPSEPHGTLVDEAIEPQPPVSPEGPAAPQESGQPVKFMRPVQQMRPGIAREPTGEAQQVSPGVTREPIGEAQQVSPGVTREPEPEAQQIRPEVARKPVPEPVPPVEEPQNERPRPSDAQLASLAELRRFRDRLERFARDLAAEYDALLGRVMTGLTSASPPTPPPPTPAPEPVAQAASSPEDALFEGRVELGVGPFYDIASLSAFERRLASLPQVTDASVRRFEASHAVVDLRLAAPMALVAELRGAMDSGFSVREVADGRILLTFDEA